MPAVSLIMPVYNTERFIERSIRSALEQTFEDLEIIVVDDCTPDDAIGIVTRVLRQYPNRRDQVAILRNPVNMGISATRQRGFDHASGTYLIHLDSDDYCEPTMIEELYRKAKQDDADIVTCDYYETFHDRELYRRSCEAGSGREYAAMILRSRLGGYLWNKLVSRKLYLDHGIRTMPGVNFWEDLNLTVRLCFHAKRISYLNRAFVHYVRYNNAAYTFRMTEKSHADIRRTTDAIVDFYRVNDPLDVYHDDLNYLKVSVKSIWTVDTRGKKRRELLKNYPEADRSIFRHPVLRLPTKLRIWFCLNHLCLLADAIGIIRRIVKKPR